MHWCAASLKRCCGVLVTHHCSFALSISLSIAVHAVLFVLLILSLHVAHSFLRFEIFISSQHAHIFFCSNAHLFSTSLILLSPSPISGSFSHQIHSYSTSQEISALMSSLFYKLDALSNFQFTPKPPKQEIVIRPSVASIAMEEVIPMAVSKDQSKAPEEVMEKPTGQISMVRLVLMLFYLQASCLSRT